MKGRPGLGNATAASAVAALIVTAGCHSPARQQTAGTAGRPPFLVVVVVDQLGAWVADERWPELPPGGGFARLRREGTTVRDMRYGHAVTETAPGHAALFTGATPRASGIFANEVVPAPGADPVSILMDPTTRPMVLPEAVPDARGAGSSLRALRVETLADVLVARRPADGLALSVSLKDRAALFGGGRHPAFVAWFDPQRATFLASTAVPPRSRPFAEAAAPGRDAIAAALAQPWVPLDLDWVRARAETADADPAEGDYEALGRTFPHPVRTGKALRATPGGDGAVLAVGQALIAAAARAGGPTLLVLSFSSFDYVSHVFGPHSYEAWDELRRIDQTLARLLDALDRSRGTAGYAVMLTADHGSGPLPELSAAPHDPWCRPAGDRWERACGPRRFLSPKAMAAALEPDLDAALGPGPWVAGIASPWVFLTDRGKSLPPAERARLVAAAERSMRARFGVTRVLDVRAQPARCPDLADDSIDALICRSVVVDGSADLYLLPRRGDVFDPRLADGQGANHGSPYLYDRAVPLVVRAPGRIAAGAVLDGPLPYTAFTHTAAALLEVPAPSGAEAGPDLTALAAPN